MTYPTEVAGDEKIVRVVKNPYHLNKNRTKLVPAAFRAPKGERDVSVIRWQYTYTDPAALKEKVRDIGGGAYCGVAHLTAAQCRASGVELVDSPQYFQGHADLVFPFAMPLVAAPLHDPAEGDESVRVAAITKALCEASTYLPDEQPTSADWTIAALPPPRG